MVAGAIVVVDQATKWLVDGALPLGRSVVVTPFFDLVNVRNPGAAFSFLAGASGWQRGFFIGIALVASVWIVWMLARSLQQRLFALALTLILGGAVGNLIDRVRLGEVIDFLHFHWAGNYFPAFNVADSAITCGAVLAVLDAFLQSRKAGSEGQDGGR
jgi:signal peptidase II